MALSPADLDDLLRLRLVVARVGEADNAGWWATEGVLGPEGRFVYERLAPRTAPFAQARVAFAAARARCADRVPTGAVTLWSLPADVEEAFEDRWATWLEQPTAWEDTFESVGDLDTPDVLGALLEHDLVGPADADEARSLGAAPPDPSVQLVSPDALDARALRRLAAGFACGRPSAPVVPYFRTAS